MNARNKETKSPIVGTLEELTACSDTVRNEFGVDGDGKVTYAHEGTTRFHLYSQTTVFLDGHVVFLDEDGVQVAGDLVEVYSEDASQDRGKPPLETHEDHRGNPDTRP